MDGHYAFGDEVAFTSFDGFLYDTFIYIFIDPEHLSNRFSHSPKNSKYLKFNIREWQLKEIEQLRCFCHKNNKNFYIIDCPPNNEFVNTELALHFIFDIYKGGFNCFQFAQQCANEILCQTQGKTVTLLDGDKTITIEDSSNKVFGYKTNVFDGNFYTGFQTWLQSVEFERYVIPDLTKMPVKINQAVLSKTNNNSYILTSGNMTVWNFISKQLGIPCFGGSQMSAETKFFIVKQLQLFGKEVIALGDGMNDYYMLKQANVGYLVKRPDGRISGSLINRNLEGILCV